MRDGDTFAVTGAAELAVGGMTMGVELGDAEEGTRGLVLAGGQLQGLDMAVTTDFAVGGLTFTADHLRVAYTPADDRFVLTGAAGASVLGNSLNVRFGGDGAEGVVIDGGRLTRLDATVSGSVAVGGVSFASDGLHLVYTPGDRTFELTGSATAALFGKELAVALGGDDTAGLRIVDGRVESMDVAVTGGFQVGGMAFQATDLRMTYSAADNSFRITGTASATFAQQHDERHLRPGRRDRDRGRQTDPPGRGGQRRVLDDGPDGRGRGPGHELRRGRRPVSPSTAGRS